MSTKIIATIDKFGLITFRNAEAVEGAGIRDEFNNYYDAGISEDFTVYAFSCNQDKSIITDDDNGNNGLIPRLKVGQKLLLLSYHANPDNQVGTEINAVFDNYKSFKDSEAFKLMNYMYQVTLFVPVNEYHNCWNGIW
jgi:hypothetical protein